MPNAARARACISVRDICSVFVYRYLYNLPCISAYYKRESKGKVVRQKRGRACGDRNNIKADRRAVPRAAYQHCRRGGHGLVPNGFPAVHGVARVLRRGNNVRSVARGGKVHRYRQRRSGTAHAKSGYTSAHCRVRRFDGGGRAVAQCNIGLAGQFRSGHRVSCNLPVAVVCGRNKRTARIFSGQGVYVAERSKSACGTGGKARARTVFKSVAVALRR